MSGKLYVVGTPIGNLEDITLRAIDCFKGVDAIACEDTRHSAILLNHLGIKKPLISYHQHSKITKIDLLIEKLKNGEKIAIISDAGTPGISDPGGTLVEAAQKEGIEIESVPGVSALTSAVSISGLNLQDFVFAGFLPHKKGRQTKLKNMSHSGMPVVFYESPYRIKKLLSEITEYFPGREIVVCRELTKKFETVYRGQVAEIEPEIKEKGEFVVIIEGTNGK
jgi:16S rRNA (cytidine1402-2'-O)-methyltransferase